MYTFTPNNNKCQKYTYSTLHALYTLYTLLYTHHTYSALLYHPCSPVCNLIASQPQCAAPPDERDIADVKNTQAAATCKELAFSKLEVWVLLTQSL